MSTDTKWAEEILCSVAKLDPMNFYEPNHDNVIGEIFVLTVVLELENTLYNFDPISIQSQSSAFSNKFHHPIIQIKVPIIGVATTTEQPSGVFRICLYLNKDITNISLLHQKKVYIKKKL